MLSDNIKALRKNKGLTQEELALRLNVVRQTDMEDDFVGFCGDCRVVYPVNDLQFRRFFCPQGGSFHR